MTAPEGAALPLADVRVPVDVLDVDVAALAVGPQVPVSHDALVLAREHGVPVATFLVGAGTTPQQWVPLVEAHRVRTPDPRRPDAAPPGARAAVVVTTIAPSEELAETLGCVLSQTLPPAEVVVVDNRPATSGVREWLAERTDPRVRYVPARLPGLARARNAGLLAIESEFVAFTDDDVRLDATWLERLVSGFDDEVACVTGLLMPTGLHTEAQLLMERFGGFSKGLLPRRYDLVEHRGDGPLFPYSMGVFGSGANAAFRTRTLREIGGFDPALGTGRVTRGGEDLDIFLRIVLRGHTLVYEPAAVGWHHHEAELHQFRQRVYGYGVGLGAVLAKHALSSPVTARAMLVRVPAALRHLGDPGSPKNVQKGRAYPARFTWLERAGIAIGPLMYARARWEARGQDALPTPPVRASSPAEDPPAEVATTAGPNWPIWCTQLELGGDLAPALTTPAGRHYVTARILVRLHGEPVGFVQLPVTDGVVSTADVLAALDGSARAAVEEHLRAEGLPVTPLDAVPVRGADCPAVVAVAPPVTVAVCTRDRGPALAACLRSLAASDYPDLEILVVDNAPRDDSTKAVFQAVCGDDPRFRYVVEPRPGLSCARNAALAEARHDIVAFTDDDVEVDRDWVHGLVRGFSRSEAVECVTGLVCTAGVEGPAEAYFDSRVGWDDSCAPQVHSLARRGRDGLFPYAPGLFGTGANFAVRVGTMRRLGGFDEALGAGTRTRGGEDLDAFVRVILSGAELAYEPSSVVWHHHRSELADLNRQMYGYGSGLSAFVAKHLLDRETRAGVLRRIPGGLGRLRVVPGSTQHGFAGAQVHRRSLMLAEFRGMAAGPLLYLRARRAARRDC